MHGLEVRPIDVLTPLAACALFGRSGEAVRRAAREGLVATPFSVAFTAKEIRLIDLSSATAYWGADQRSGHEPFKTEVDRMRDYGVVIQFDEHQYAVLHPFPLIATGRQVGLLSDLELS